MKGKEVLTAKQFLIETGQFHKYEIWRNFKRKEYRKEWYLSKISKKSLE